MPKLKIMKNTATTRAQIAVPPLTLPETLDGMRELYDRLIGQMKEKGYDVSNLPRRRFEGTIGEPEVLEELVIMFWNLIHCPLRGDSAQKSKKGSQ